MIFLLLGSLIALHEMAAKRGNTARSGIAEAGAFQKVSDKFANVMNNAASITTNPAEKKVDERIVPFSYFVDGNTLTIGSEIPARQDNIDFYLENMNAFRLFLEDTNHQREYDSMKVDANTLTPKSWGGSDANVSFITEPHCLRFYIMDENVLEFRFTCADYNYLSIRRQDINISFVSGNDFNALACSFNGAGSCPDNAFDPANPLPYLSVNLLDTNCSGCVLSQKIIRGHFNPSQTSTLNVSCAGALCSNPPVDLNFTGITRARFAGSQRIGFSIGINLASGIIGLNFNDLNMMVENTEFGAKRWNN